MPLIVGGYRVTPLVRTTIREVLRDRVTGLAAQAAFFLLFSIFPLLLAVVPLVGLLGDRERVFAAAMRELAPVVPGEALSLVRDVVESVLFVSGAPVLVSFGTLGALWSASRVFDAVQRALNTVQARAETRPWWRRKLASVGVAAVAGLLIVGATAALFIGPAVVGAAARAAGNASAARGLWSVLRYPLALSFVVAAFSVAYAVLPNRAWRSRGLLVGAVVGTALWALVTLGFRLYTTHFASYNATYGVLGAVIVLLTWLYLSMLAVLVGGELNAELERGTGAVRPRTGVLFTGGTWRATANRPPSARLSDPRVG